MKNSILKSWRTSIFGFLCIAWAVWSAHVNYVPYLDLWHNVRNQWPAQEALFLIGIGLLHARDHKAKD